MTWHFDELAARRARRAEARGRFLFYCEANTCVCSLEMTSATRDQLTSREAVAAWFAERGWFCGMGLPPVILCPQHSAGLGGRSA